MKTYRIYFWHGRSGPKDPLVKELSAFCDVDDEGELTYTGTLDQFAETYGKHFIWRPNDLGDDLICVTQYSYWGMR